MGVGALFMMPRKLCLHGRQATPPFLLHRCTHTHRCMCARPIPLCPSATCSIETCSSRCGGVRDEFSVDGEETTDSSISNGPPGKTALHTARLTWAKKVTPRCCKRERAALVTRGGFQFCGELQRTSLIEGSMYVLSCLCVRKARRQCERERRQEKSAVAHGLAARVLPGTARGARFDSFSLPLARRTRDTLNYLEYHARGTRNSARWW